MIFFFIVFICALILFLAFRILLKLIFGAAALAKFDRGAEATFGFVGKATIVVLAGLIVFAIVSFARS